MNRVVPIAAIWLLLSGAAMAASIVCTPDRTGSAVTITMQVPHPNHALILRPDQSVDWLQTSPDNLHDQIENFAYLASWQITPETQGTVWIDGQARVENVLTVKGEYNLYIADNLETEPENTYFIECFFTVR